LHSNLLASLMTKAHQGDAHAYRQLLNLIIPLLQSYLRRRISNLQEAEDICQETLLKIHTFRHTYNPDQKFESWMFSICRNSMIDFLRSRGRKREFLAISKDQEFETPEFQDAGLRLEFEQALKEIPHEQLEALLLSNVEGKSFDEIAKQTGASLSAVKVRAHRGIKMLKAALLGDEQ
jgi:RNA polymerase sigma-70 factor, ECF subfamily